MADNGNVGDGVVDNERNGIDIGISDAASGIEMIMTLGAFYLSNSWLLANDSETNTNTITNTNENTNENTNTNTNTHGDDYDTGSFLSFR